MLLPPLQGRLYETSVSHSSRGGLSPLANDHTLLVCLVHILPKSVPVSIGRSVQAASVGRTQTPQTQPIAPGGGRVKAKTTMSLGVPVVPKTQIDRTNPWFLIVRGLPGIHWVPVPSSGRCLGLRWSECLGFVGGTDRVVGPRWTQKMQTMQIRTCLEPEHHGSSGYIELLVPGPPKKHKGWFIDTPYHLV